jgi:glycosyltransferase involved in cell wall biosynthesis
MRFSIITPTFKRKDALIRAVNSLIAQTYKDFEMIIVNDSPYDTTYQEFAASINDPRIHYYINDSNRGVNYSRNFALDHVSADSKWVIFLDDDDYLAPDALATFVDLIRTHHGRRWFLTNRAYKDGTPLTVAPRTDTVYSYAWEYLIFRRLRGDATHCIETRMLSTNHIRFAKHIKQGEEWLFFFQVGMLEKIYYHDHNSTITQGYDEHHGLNFRKRSFSERADTLSRIIYEGIRYKIITVSFLFYLCLRFIALFIRRK